MILTSINTLPAKSINKNRKNSIINERLQLAYGLTEKGFYKEAIKEYKDIKNKFPDYTLGSTALSKMAFALLKTNQGKKAAKIYKKLLNKYPDKTNYNDKINYTLILGKKGNSKKKYNKAQKILRNLIKDSNAPKKARASSLYHLGKLYSNHKKFKKASKLFNKVIKKYPDTKYKYYAKLGNADIKLNKKEFKKAKNEYQRLINNSKTPDFIVLNSLNSLANIYKQKNEFAKAAEYYGKIISRFKDTATGKQAILNRFNSLLKAKKYPKLISEVNNHIESSTKSDSLQLQLIKGYAYKKQNFFSHAYSIFRRVFKNSKNRKYIKISFVQAVDCLIKMKELKKAKALVIAVSSSNLIPNKSKKRLYNLVAPKIPDLQKRINFLKRLIKRTTDDKIKSFLYYKLGLTFNKYGEPRKAIKCFNTILKQADGELQSYALYEKSLIFYKLDKYNEALSSTNKILNKYKDTNIFPETILLKIKLLFKKNDSSKIKSLISKNIDRIKETPQYETVLFYLGYINFYQQKYKKSKKVFKKLIAQKKSEELDNKTNLYLGLIAYKNDNLKKALDIFSPLIKSKESLKNYNPHILYQIANLYFELEKYKKAKEIYKFLLSTNKNNLVYNVYFKLSEIAQKNDKYKKAIKFLNKCLDYTVKEIQKNKVRTKIGFLYIQQDKYQDATFYFQQILDYPTDNETSSKARLGLAKAFSSQQKKLEKAERYATSAYVLSKNNKIKKKAMILSCKISLMRENFKNAKEKIKDILKEFPSLKESKKIQELRKKLNNNLTPTNIINAN